MKDSLKQERIFEAPIEKNKTTPTPLLLLALFRIQNKLT